MPMSWSLASEICRGEKSFIEAMEGVNWSFEDTPSDNQSVKGIKKGK